MTAEGKNVPLDEKGQQTMKRCLTRKVGMGLSLIFVCTLSAAQTSVSNPPLRIGGKAPAFELKGMNGKTVKLSDLINDKQKKNLMLVFWTTTCSSCVKVMPMVQKIQEQLKPVAVEPGKEPEVNPAFKDLTIVTIALDKLVAEKMADYVKSQKYTFPVLLDPERKASLAYQVRVTPTAYFISKDGVVWKKDDMLSKRSEAQVLADLNSLQEGLYADLLEKEEEPRPGAG